MSILETLKIEFDHREEYFDKARYFLSEFWEGIKLGATFRNPE